MITRAALLAEIDANKQNFTIAAREGYWNDHDAARAYASREFDKRSIPDPSAYWE